MELSEVVRERVRGRKSKPFDWLIEIVLYFVKLACVKIVIN